MGRKRNLERDASLKRYLDSGGKATLAKLAEAAGVSKSCISKWKTEDKWDEQLKGSRKEIRTLLEEHQRKTGIRMLLRMGFMHKQN